MLLLLFILTCIRKTLTQIHMARPSGGQPSNFNQNSINKIENQMKKTENPIPFLFSNLLILNLVIFVECLFVLPQSMQRTALQ